MKLKDGSVVHFRPIGETSYGEPAGLFGINCRHVYKYISEEDTEPDYEVPSKEENDRIYKLEQKQTYMERQIRNLKRKQAILKPRKEFRGDQKLEIKALNSKVSDQLQNLLNRYREFTAENHIKARVWRLGKFQ